jgi:hypothetical protein
MLSTASVPFPDEDLISSDDVIARAETRLLQKQEVERLPSPDLMTATFSAEKA